MTVPFLFDKQKAIPILRHFRHISFFHYQDLISNSPHSLTYNFCDVNSENLALDQLNSFELYFALSSSLVCLISYWCSKEKLCRGHSTSLRVAKFSFDLRRMVPSDFGELPQTFAGPVRFSSKLSKFLTDFRLFWAILKGSIWF